jgi:benzoyl-CoA reductase subunit C
MGAVATDLRTLDAWQDLSLEDLLNLCRDVVEDVDFSTVSRWREAGGKTFGHFQVYFPEELVHAAGMLPVKIRGSLGEAKTADSHFGSYLCSIVKTSLELALSGRVELDMFVSLPICDTARNLAAIWGRNVDYPSEILYLPQNANSSHTAPYLAGEYRRLLSEIETVAGRTVSDDDVRASLEVYNESRDMLRQLYAIRRESPWKIAPDEAYALVALSGMIPRDEHNELMRAVLPMIEARDAPQHDRLRVVFEGGFCEQPPLDLLRILGRSTYVVDDDLLIGLRWILSDVAVDGDPVANLATAYLEQSSYSAVQHDDRKPKEKMLLERIRSSGAEAAIVSAAKMCEPGLDEQVAYAKSLDEEMIPYFVTEFEEGMTSFEQLEIQLETFVENLLFA